MPDNPHGLFELLQMLADHQVTFIVILGLAKIIENKSFANSEKDRAVLPLLRRTLAQ